MRLKHIVLLLLTAGIAACHTGVTHNKKAAASDTIAYTCKTFKQRDTACGNNPDSACTIVKIKYPVFDSLAMLNDSIQAKFTGLFAINAAKPITGLPQLAENFIGVYSNFKKESPKSTLYYLLDAQAKVLSNDSDIITLEVSGYSYHGGPHGVDYTSYINWNPQTGKSIALADIFTNGYTDKLNHIAEHIFRKNEKLGDTSSLCNGRTYFFKNNKFALPPDYLITPKGISFLYNVYTIKPFAAGKTELLVPYADVKSLMKSDAVVKRYL